MAGPVPLQEDRAAWCRERLDFFSAVINNLDRESLKAELESCETEEDAAGLMHSLLWFQDNVQVQYPGGAVANDPPHPHQLPGEVLFPEGHEPLYVAVEDPPVHLPHHHHQQQHQGDENDPVAAGEPHVLLQDVYLGDHNHQRHHDQHQQQQDNEDYEALPMALFEPQILEDAAAYPEDHNHQPHGPEKQQQQQQQQQQQPEQQEQQENQQQPPPQLEQQQQQPQLEQQQQQPQLEQQQQQPQLEQQQQQPQLEQQQPQLEQQQQQQPQLEQQQQIEQEQQQQQATGQQQQHHEGFEDTQDQLPPRTDPLEPDSASGNTACDNTAAGITVGGITPSGIPVGDITDEDTQAQLPRRADPLEADSASDITDYHDLQEDHVEGVIRNQEWAEDPELPHHHDRENIAMAASDDGEREGYENTEPMEPPSERDESDPYFDADEPSVEDFVDVEEVPIEEDLVMVPFTEDLVLPLAARANVQAAPTDLEVEGAVGGHEEDTKDDERLAQELSERLNEEERLRLENDERMARELAEQMEEEERRREEEDEELARRLANEMEGEEMDQQLQQQAQGQENNPPEDIIADPVVEDNLVAMAQVEEEEDMRDDEEMARLMELRVQEDERAGRMAAVINMFPDADPTYLDQRMEQVETEEDFRNTVEALLTCQQTEPRMSGYQKVLKQSHAARAAEDPHNDPPQEPMAATAHSYAFAAVNNRLFECTICFEEEVRMKDVASCNALYNYHEFCIECIRKHVAALIGQGHSSFRCMNGFCEAEFSWRTLRRVMEPVVYRKVQERRQQEEVMAAGVENLVSCPFCCFMIIMPDPENKVLECLNPECLKESCRVCKEQSHIPLRCEEVEREVQKDARTMLENRMAEAMIRQCPKCGKRFVTEGGCNKMTCSCGTVMCYLCKSVITDGYKHFEQRGGVASGKCPLWSDATDLHRGEVRDAAARGKQELDPELRLVHDPTNDMA